MKDLFSVKRRELLSNGLMRAFSLSFGAGLISDFIWKTPLKAKWVAGIIMLFTLLIAWITCPTKDSEGEKEE